MEEKASWWKKREMPSVEHGCLTADFSWSSQREFLLLLPSRHGGGVLNQITVIVWPEIEITLSELGRCFSVNGALRKYGIIPVVTPNDERGVSSAMQSGGVSVPKGHNLYRWHSTRHFLGLWPMGWGLGCVCVCACNHRNSLGANLLRVQ